eukprot:8925398-Alexandrium_andersonii.AAC.1
MVRAEPVAAMACRLRRSSCSTEGLARSRGHGRGARACRSLRVPCTIGCAGGANVRMAWASQAAAATCGPQYRARKRS